MDKTLLEEIWHFAYWTYIVRTHIEYQSRGTTGFSLDIEDVMKAKITKRTGTYLILQEALFISDHQKEHDEALLSCAPSVLLERMKSKTIILSNRKKALKRKTLSLNFCKKFILRVGEDEDHKNYSGTWRFDDDLYFRLDDDPDLKDPRYKSEMSVFDFLGERVIVEDMPNYFT